MSVVKMEHLNPLDWQTKTDTCANIVDSDEMAYNELSHQDLHYLPFCFFVLFFFILDGKPNLHQ